MSGIDTYWVFIQLSSRSEDTADWSTNRIALKCETVGITTSKQVLSFPIPGSGMITGESTALGLDLGMATKTINMGGIITTQEIRKKFPKGSLKETEAGVRTDYADTNGLVTVTMTPHEIAQLLHSYVDSSALQTYQNMNELLVLHPSFVGKDFLYHKNSDWTAAGHSSPASVDQNLTDDEVDALDPYTAPLIPFTYAVRDIGLPGKKLDNQFGYNLTPERLLSDFPDPVTTSADANGMKGFIRTFNTTFTGGNPFVNFTMDFEVAITGLK